MQNNIKSPREFFEVIVMPDFDDFYKNQGNIRLAFHVCMSIDHLADWIAKSLGQNRGNFLKAKYEECADLEIIRNLSSNAKHFPPDRAPIMHVATTAASVPVDNFVNVDDITDWDLHGAGDQVIARMENGNKFWLLNPITSAYTFWKREYENETW